ncbi:MAG: hypothetical protein M0R80_08370 [Proteobacteria bacterium]|jgi:hypothetical protein|nr:hypothetical protein [Pseudomonadota bacterium]
MNGELKHFFWKGLYMSQSEEKRLANEVQPVMVITPEAQVLQMTNKELIAAFDPTEVDSLVAQRLKVKAGCNPFMVWNEETGERFVDASVTCLEEIIAGYQPRTSMVVGDRVCPVLPLGMRPNVWVPENPCQGGAPLHRDGRSDAGIFWGGISMHIQQLIRVGFTQVDPKEITGTEQSIYTMVYKLSDNEADQLFQRSALKLRDMVAAGTEPKLRVQLGKK